MTTMAIRTTTRWSMFAQRMKMRDGVGYLNFGRRGWASRIDGEGVVSVELRESPDGTYFGWVQTDTNGNDAGGPVHVCNSRDLLAHYYSGGNPHYDMDVDALAGRGRIVQLAVDEIGPA